MNRATEKKLPSCHSRLPTSNLSRPDDMTLAEFVKLYSVQPNVDVRRFCELAGIGTTRFYELVKADVIRIRKNGRLTTAPVEDLYRLLRGDQAAA